MMRNGTASQTVCGRVVCAVESYSFACWLFCALVAVVRPARLPEAPLALPFHLRTDTLGMMSFILVGVTTLPRRWLAEGRTWRGRLGPGRKAAGPTGRTSDAVLRTFRDLTFLLATYVAANYLAHPATMILPLTHVASWPSERAAGLDAFALSWAATMLLALPRSSCRAEA
jgi:hypothetical protein